MNEATLFNIQLDLRKRDYASARSKCDSALRSLKGLDSVPILLARAEAIRSVPDSDLEMALKDVKKAISIDPKNPFCQLSLGEVLQEMSITAFNLGKSLCHSQEHSAALGRLHSFSIAASDLMKSAGNNNFDPVFLPKEVLQIILLPLTPSEKARCLKVSRDWRNHLTSEPSLWRSLFFNLNNSKWERFIESSPWKLYGLYSNNSLTSVDIKFGSFTYSSMVRSCLDSLKESCQTLKSIIFNGEIENLAALPQVLKLASQCRNLQRLHYNVDERIEFDENEEQEDYDQQQRWESDERYRERMEEQIRESCQEFIKFDEIKFNCQPLHVSLFFSDLSLPTLGDCKLFSKAKTVNLTCTSGYWISKFELFTLLKSGSQSLEVLTLDDEGCDVSPIQGFYRDEEKAMVQLQLPKLNTLRIQSDGDPAIISRGKPIEIIAPALSSIPSDVCVTNLIVNQGQDLAVTTKNGGR